MSLTQLPVMTCRLLPALCLMACVARSHHLAGAELQLSVVDESGKTLPSRVLIRPARQECLVPDGLVELAIGPDRWFMSPGKATVNCEPGNVLVRVEHGHEFVRFKETLRVPEEGLKKTITLERWIDLRERGYLCGENHLHVDSKTLAPMLACEGLDFGSSMTWWNGPDQRRPIPPGRGPVRPLSFAGTTTPTSVFDAELEYAWGAAYIQGLPAPLPIETNRKRPNLDYLRHARQAGGIIHYQAGWSREVLLDALLGCVDTVNVCNNNFHLHRYQQRPHYSNLLNVEGFPVYPPRESGMQQMNFETYYRLLNCGLKLAAGAGSATGVKQNPAGFNRACVRCDAAATIDDFYKAWAEGRNFVTNGPMLFLKCRAGAQRAAPGDTLTLNDADSDVRITVEAQCHEPNLTLDRVEIIVNGHVAWRQGDPGSDAAALHESLMTVPLKVRRGSWIAARCIAADRLLTDQELSVYSHGKQEDRYRMRPSRFRFAHTSPVYVEFNGKPPGDEHRLREGQRMLDRFEAFTRKNCAEEFLDDSISAINTARSKLQARIDDVGMARAERIKKLRKLKCIVFEKQGKVVEVQANGSSLLSQDLHLLSGFTEITDLSFERVALRDLGLAHLIRLRKLEWLNLYRTQVSDAGLAHLKRLPSLKLLPIGGTRITDAGLKNLGAMKQLRYLGLRGNSITDQGVAHLKPLANLTGLHLGETQITDQALPHLAGMKKLQRLWLHDTRVSDASIETLSRMSSLRELHLYRTKISENGRKQLVEDLPRCRIVTNAD